MTGQIYYVVVAFRCRPLLLDRDGLADQLTKTIRATCNEVQGLDVAVREAKPPRKGKITSGQWGDHGI